MAVCVCGGHMPYRHQSPRVEGEKGGALVVGIDLLVLVLNAFELQSNPEPLHVWAKPRCKHFEILAGSMPLHGLQCLASRMRACYRHHIVVDDYVAAATGDKTYIRWCTERATSKKCATFSSGVPTNTPCPRFMMCLLPCAALTVSMIRCSIKSLEPKRHPGSMLPCEEPWSVGADTQTTNTVSLSAQHMLRHTANAPGWQHHAPHAQCRRPCPRCRQS